MAWNKYLTAEVPLFFCMFCTILQGGVLQNLYIFRTCYVILGYNESDCAQLGKVTNNMTQFLEQKAQPIVNQIQMGIDIVTFFALFFCIYVGIWSDKFGRKPFLLLCLFGNTMNSIIYAILMFFHYVSPWWVLVCQVPLIFTGNFATLFIILTTYITDVTTASDRMIRMALFQVIFGIGQFLGSFLTPYIFYGTSYEFTFCLTASLLTFTLVYAYFFIPESLPREKEKFEIKNLLKYINFLEILNTALKQRPNNGRRHILLIIGIIVVTGFATGEMSVLSLFLRVKFGWTLTNVSMFNSVTCVLVVIATALGTYIFYQKMKIKEIPLALASCLISMVVNLLRAIAVNDYYIYVAAGINLFSVLGGLMLKTLLTFMVAPEEMGKIISLLDISLSLTGTLANFVYPLVYRSTIDINPAIYNYISLGGNAIGAIGTLYLLKLELPYYAPAIGNEEFIKSNKAIPYEHMYEEKDE